MERDAVIVEVGAKEAAPRAWSPHAPHTPRPGGRRSELWCGWLVAVVLLPSCVTVDYVGKTYPPTSNVDIYMSAADVKRRYEVIGEARAQVPALPLTSPAAQLQEKLLAEARSRGADGIILGQLTERQVGETRQTTGQASAKGKDIQYSDTTTTSVDEVTELRALLIKYEDE